MTLEIALELNAETGWPIFPCKADKAPACPRGFHAAVADPAAIRSLYRQFPGPLIGVPTGPASGISVLDLDIPKHPEAGAWLDQHRASLGKTLVIQTRSGGQHWIYNDRADLRCSVAKIAAGVDFRAAGGYVIFWAAHGGAVLDASPIAPWPAWLRNPEPKPEPAPRPIGDIRTPQKIERTIAGLVRTVAQAAEGARNSKLYWACHRLHELAERGELDRGAAKALARAAAQHSGLPARERELTIRSAFDGSTK
ncbi:MULTISPECIES: bifunctional DNA primase/polymerase [unclassified Acidiphilium]|uniref:bifunctional DNA primase/polymerase n=1 Tax=unclassified Acidiphilium TaxID=2617493 RepID=UPI000BC78B5E|nr:MULTISPECIES: bifunctional DNA primase/polymerase [unclassified Acidiphilium]OZB22294.1 MAG: hypothetical protein B7X49_17165 [Acidiphilium sp. 34-64-41]